MLSHENFCVLISFGILVSSNVVYLSKEPIHCILALVCSFLQGGILLLAHEVEFLGILLLIIYLGAIVVLFLFVVMLLKPKHVGHSINYTTLLCISFLQLCFVSLVLFDECYIKEEESYLKGLLLFDSLTNIEIFGQVLYTQTLICVLLVGLILLTAIIGAIVLAHTFNKNKFSLTEVSSRKLSRTPTIASFE